jgi:small subunit ribosomal protein S20
LVIIAVYCSFSKALNLATPHYPASLALQFAAITPVQLFLAVPQKLSYLNFSFYIAFPYLCRPKFSAHMANHQATKKDMRQSAKRRDRNKYYGKTTRNAIRDLKDIKASKEGGEALPKVASMIDKLAKKGIIHKNKAANLKRKLTKKINALAK